MTGRSHRWLALLSVVALIVAAVAGCAAVQATAPAAESTSGPDRSEAAPQRRATEQPATPEATPEPTPEPTATESAPPPARDTVRIAYLHHSTGENIWNGGVPEFIAVHNEAQGTDYRITELAYPDTSGGYPWENYPYDYWNLWVNRTGTSQDRGELNLDQLAADYDVIVFKHCFPVSDIGPDSDSDPPSVTSSARTVAIYTLQYQALKDRMREFGQTRFIVWTGAAETERATNPESAERARTFFAWVRDTWDEPGDNIFVWDFRTLETGGGLYLKPSYASAPDDPHPNAAFSTSAAPRIGRRIVDVIEGRGDSGSVTGQ
jgi:hypothetical protein